MAHVHACFFYHLQRITAFSLTNWNWYHRHAACCENSWGCLKDGCVSIIFKTIPSFERMDSSFSSSSIFWIPSIILLVYSLFTQHFQSDMRDKPKFVPDNITSSTGSARIYERIMQNARISKQNIQSMKEMIGHTNAVVRSKLIGDTCSDDAISDNDDTVDAASRGLFNDIASRRQFDDYGYPLRHPK